MWWSRIMARRRDEKRRRELERDRRRLRVANWVLRTMESQEMKQLSRDTRDT